MNAALEAEAALLQLSSAALPVGAYSYSQGLETAIADGRLKTPVDVERFIADVLRLVVARYEAPVWWRLRAALDAGDVGGFATWNDDFLATRESAELRAETLQMGHSMIELLEGLAATDRPTAATTATTDAATQATTKATTEAATDARTDAFPSRHPIDAWTWPAAHALASRTWRIAPRAALTGYLFGWLENQVLAGMKALPYGQLAGQRILQALRPSIASVARDASTRDDDDLSTQAPGYAITSARHESQYSRLFRS